MLHQPLGVSEEFKGSSEWGDYGDAIQELDFHTGRLLDRLEALGLADDTVVLYLSDNGRGPGRHAGQPIRGSKLTTYEGGLRVPAIAWGPGVGIRAGHESDGLVHAMDWYPTLASLAGIEVPASPVLDGRDLADLLRGKTDDIPLPSSGSLNASLPWRRSWNPPGEWAGLIDRLEYQNAFF